MFLFTKQMIGVLAVGFLLLFACTHSETLPAGSISLQKNQSARLSTDVTARVDSIWDSRCPKNVNISCIWAGNAIVKFVVSTSSDSTAFRLTLGGYPTPVGTTPPRLDSTNVSLANQTYKVILRDVTPYPGTGSPGQAQRAVIQVTPL